MFFLIHRINFCMYLHNGSVLLVFFSVDFFFYYKSFNTKKLIMGFTTISNICIFYVHIIKFPLKSSGIKFTFSSRKRLMTTKSVYIALNIMPFFEMDFPIAHHSISELNSGFSTRLKLCKHILHCSHLTHSYRF